MTRVTIADIAREAGVSRMTVSRVINNKEGVGEETRQQIATIIKRLGYRRSDVARSLVTQQTRTLGLVVQDITNPFFSGIARGVEQTSRTRGYSVLLCDAEENAAYELSALQVLDEKRVDGVVLCSSRLEPAQLSSILNRHPATVLVNCLLLNQDESLTVDSVVINENAGGLMATRHLLAAGHRTVGFLGGPPLSFGSQGRFWGYCQALQEANLPVRQEYVRFCQPTVDGGYAVARGLLAACPELTALFCYNDLVAVGVLKACAELGRRIPSDLAVVGYDDIPLAALVIPPLTTCQVQRETLGQIAAELVIDRINGKTQAYEKRVVQPTLVVRASAPLPA